MGSHFIGDLTKLVIIFLSQNSIYMKELTDDDTV